MREYSKKILLFNEKLPQELVSELEYKNVKLIKVLKNEFPLKQEHIKTILDRSFYGFDDFIKDGKIKEIRNLSVNSAISYIHKNQLTMLKLPLYIAWDKKNKITENCFGLEEVKDWFIE